MTSQFSGQSSENREQPGSDPGQMGCFREVARRESCCFQEECQQLIQHGPACSFWKDCRRLITNAPACCFWNECRHLLKDSPAHSGELPDETRTPHTRGSQIVALMLDYVRDHFDRPMALSDVAAALKMNSSYLSDLFSRTMGITFHNYVNELRLAKAKELLEDPRVRICEVACAVGFASPNHFRNFFKTHVGASPSEWRARR